MSISRSGDFSTLTPESARLDNIDAHGATIVTNLQGVKPQEGVDVAHGETVWIGSASANVTLLAFTKRGGDHAKRFPGKVGKAGGSAGLDRAGAFRSETALQRPSPVLGKMRYGVVKSNIVIRSPTAGLLVGT
jgi:hypothetical protein